MMKLAALAALAAPVAAFAPAPHAPRSRTALDAASADRSPWADELGAQPPLGFYDPLGLLEGADQATFDRLRETEIKHGRISMVATVGYLTTASGYRFPNVPPDVPAGFKAFDALFQTDDGLNILGQMVVFFALAEAFNRNVPWSDTEPEFPGDYRNGSLDFGWDKFNPEEKMKWRATELANGRAAMCGILGLTVHEQIGNIDAILPIEHL